LAAERALLADDDPLSRDFLAEALAGCGLQVTAATDGEAAIARLRQEPYDFLFTDYKMPGRDGVAVLAESKLLDPDRPVVLVTAHGTLPVAVDALRAGADDILEKPVSPEDLELALHRVRDRRKLRRENRWLKRQSEGQTPLVHGAAMQRVVDLVQRVAASKASVLITGESGVGKERVATLVHRLSDRAERPFVTLNCAAVPDALIESELFGHEAGAFTGAGKAREGRFEIADGGTLFLDEIGEMAPPMQSKLLRVLQSGELQRVGGGRTIQVDLRVVSATNRDLLADVRAQRFREDLYYRLNVVPIHVPPLRERADEIIPLARSFLLHGARLSPGAEQELLRHRWPGNVRELQNLLQRCSLLCRDGVIDVDTLREWLQLRPPPPRPCLPEAEVPLLDPCAALVGRRLADVERALIERTLQSCGGNRTRAAAILGIGVRTLFDRLRVALR
jgi:DNA-binding NtrC family response regulator